MNKRSKYNYNKRYLKGYLEDKKRVYLRKNIAEAIKLYAHTEKKTLQKATEDLIWYGFAVLGFVPLTNPAAEEVKAAQLRLAGLRRTIKQTDVKRLRAEVEKNVTGRLLGETKAEEEAHK